MAVLLVQAPLVALLMCIVFKDQSPQDVLTVLFLLGFVSLWFGVNNSAREIVGELALLRREKRAELNTAAYLGSKIVGQGFITFLQVALMLAVTLGMLDHIHLDFGPALAVCWSVSLVGIAIGLALSSTVKTQIAAVVAVPLILIPVILLGGLIKPYPDMKGAVKLLADVTPVRWSFDMLTALCHNVPEDFFNGAGWVAGSFYLAIVFALMVAWSLYRLKRV
ncbi:MAG: ABC transporter permease [Verrucomicrobiota bacterium]